MVFCSSSNATGSGRPFAGAHPAWPEGGTCSRADSPSRLAIVDTQMLDVLHRHPLDGRRPGLGVHRRTSSWSNASPGMHDSTRVQSCVLHEDNPLRDTGYSSRARHIRSQSCPGGMEMSELAPEVLTRLSTPDRVESRLGGLEFTDGAPSAKAVETLYDHLDYVHALNAFLTAFPPRRPGRSGKVPRDRRRGQLRPDLLGADGLVVAVPDRERRHHLLHHVRRPERRPDGRRDAADGVGHVRRHVVPVGHRLRSSRPRSWCRRQVPPGPAGLRRHTPRRGLLRRSLAHQPRADAGPVVHGGRDPAPTVATIKSTLKVYPYAEGGPGTSVAHPPPGRPAARTPGGIPETTFVEGSGATFNTIPPNDFGFWETVNAWFRTRPSARPTPRSSGTSPRSAS